jgi:hypothetical protein
MKRYKYVIIDIYALTNVRIVSTDLDSLNIILTNLQKILPNCQVKPLEKDLEGVGYTILVEQKGKNRVAAKDIEWWIIKQLCNSGWKPIGEGRYVYEEDY